MIRGWALPEYTEVWEVHWDFFCPTPKTNINPREGRDAQSYQPGKHTSCCVQRTFWPWKYMVNAGAGPTHEFQGRVWGLTVAERKTELPG